jgi:hypothetical protein
MNSAETTGRYIEILKQQLDAYSRKMFAKSPDALQKVCPPSYFPPPFTLYSPLPSNFLIIFVDIGMPLVSRSDASKVRSFVASNDTWKIFYKIRKTWRHGYKAKNLSYHNFFTRFLGLRMKFRNTSFPKTRSTIHGWKDL